MLRAAGIDTVFCDTESGKLCHDPRALPTNSMHLRIYFCAAIISTATLPLCAEEVQTVKAGAAFAATDTLNCGMETSADATECLEGLSWTCAPFRVTCEAAGEGKGDWLMRGLIGDSRYKAFLRKLKLPE